MLLMENILRRRTIDDLEPGVRDQLGSLIVDELQEALPLTEIDDTAVRGPDVLSSYTPVTTPAPSIKVLDAPMCHVCGDQMRPAGACYACMSCGATSGCS